MNEKASVSKELNAKHKKIRNCPVLVYLIIEIHLGIKKRTLLREGVMHHLVGMKNTLSRFNPGVVEIDDYGNYNLEVGGVEGTLLANKSVLNLYFLDRGDYSTVPSIHGYGWIKASQQVWFQQTSWSLQVNKLAIFFKKIHLGVILYALSSDIQNILK